MLEKVKEYFLEEKKIFIQRREINYRKIKFVAVFSLMVFILSILFFSETPKSHGNFHESTSQGSVVQSSSSTFHHSEPMLEDLQNSNTNIQNVHSSLDVYYKKSSPRGSHNDSSNHSMIILRDGNRQDKLLAGTRFKVMINQNLKISNQPLNVIGIIVNDVLSSHEVSIPRGSNLLGQISFDESSERASVHWNTVIFPDGKEFPISAIGMSNDGELGLIGDVQTEAFKNALGQTLGRFVGAYAAGSMNTGAFGANVGGHANGLRNAIAQTATDKANSIGESLKKEHKWIEIEGGTVSWVVLEQPFDHRGKQ